MVRPTGLRPKQGHAALLTQGTLSCVSAIHLVVIHLDAPNFSPCALPSPVSGSSASSKISVNRPSYMIGMAYGNGQRICGILLQGGRGFE